jgi:hypothetical protein
VYARDARNLHGEEGIGSRVARGFKTKRHAMLRFARAHDELTAGSRPRDETEVDYTRLLADA